MRCASLSVERFVLLVLMLGLQTTPGQGADTDRPHLFGVGTANGGWTLLEPAGYTEAMYDAMAHVGTTSTRLGASWGTIESVRGVYDWSSLDEDVSHCLSRRITPYCLIVNTPAWASPTGEFTHAYAPLSAFNSDFQNFCTALAARYAGRIDRWEFWNEQNGYGWHTDGGFNRVDEYVPFLRRAYYALKAGNPNCMVAIGGLDDPDINPGDLTGWRGANFMRLFYEEVNRRGWQNEDFFDAVADHPYHSREELGDLRYKLRTLHNELEWHGDGHKPVWITEYGWSTKWDDMSDQAQAQLFHDYLAILMEPEFDYVTMASCLAISDMETGYDGWGLTDQNLRPKPAFYAFQSFPRSAAPQVSHIEWRPVDWRTIEVVWKTHVPATSQIEFGATTDYGSLTPLDAALLTEHAMRVEGLVPGSLYHLRILAGAPGLPSSTSADYLVRCADGTVPNGDFEQGVPGIAKWWRTIGRSFCTDSAVVGKVHTGAHGQTLVAVGDWGEILDDTLHTHVAVVRGAEYSFSAYTRVETGVAGANKLRRRVGTDPTGGTNPAAPSVIWSAADTVEDMWALQSVTANAQSPVVSVFVETKALQYIDGLHWLHVDEAAVATDTAIVLADLDRDGDVDVMDFKQFEACANGPSVPPTDPGCLNTDLDFDGDVDQDDYGIFQRNLGL